MLLPNSLSDSALLQKISDLAHEERRLTLEILHLLKEVEARSLHLSLGFSSLHEYAVRALKYSEGAAHRRISAMRLLKSVPQAEAAIQAGTLTLSNVSLVQTFLRAEERESRVTRSTEEKRDLLMSMAGQSRRECEQKLAELSPRAMTRPERIGPISGELTQIHLTVNSKLMQKLERIRQLASHQIGDESLASLLEYLADQTLARLEKKVELATRSNACQPTEASTPPAGPTAGSEVPKAQDAPMGTQKSMISRDITRTSPRPALVSSRSRYIPIASRRQIWTRAQGRCEYLCPRSGHRCESRRFLEIDHRHPYALGGSNASENLRLLCQPHNRFEAAKVFGSQRQHQVSPRPS